MIANVREGIASVSRSDFGRNAIWFAGLSAAERFVAVIQAVLISRALGITEYGVYGLLFGTAGFVASVVGLQMGLTATVFVSKYREAEKMKAAAVISVVERFGWIVAAVFFLAAVPFASTWSELLLGSTRYQAAILLGIVFVSGTIVSGVQDGVAQGFEIFGALAKLKVVASSLTLAAVFFAGRKFGLDGVLCVILGGLVLKFAGLALLVRKTRRAHRIPSVGAGVSFRTLVSGFAIPSMAVSLAVGFVTWMGMFMLSKQPAGFDGVAIANTGLQWRGPVLLLAASLGGVAVPAFSRLATQGDSSGSRKLRRNLTLVNLVLASAVALVVIAASGWIMNLYGGGFAQGRLAFCLIVLSTIPAVVANVYLQELVGAARMWRQLWLQIPYLLAMGFLFAVLIPRFHVLGYAVAMLFGASVLLFQVVIMDRRETPRTHAARQVR